MRRERIIAAGSGWLVAGLMGVAVGFGAAPLIGSSGVADPAGRSGRAFVLSGTSWQLAGIYVPDDGTTAPDDGSKYTIAFGADGRARIRADCNRGVASWHVGADSALMFGRVRMTRVRCAPGSMHQRFVNDLAFVRRYELDAGRLRLDLRAQGGRLDFVPMAP